MNSRLIAIIRKEFLQILRDPRTLALILIIPIMQLFLLGYAATSDVRNVPLAVWDQSQSPASRALLDAFRAADYFKIAYAIGSEAELQDLIERGEARAGIIIPPTYANDLDHAQAQIAIVIDGSDPTSASTALSAAQLISQQHATKILAEQVSRKGIPFQVKPPLEARTQVWYNPDLISAHFMIPGVIGMILYAITAILTASSIVRERERGTIEQLIVTPIRSWELVIGKVMPYVILALLDTVEIIAVGHWWFGVPVRGNIWMILLFSGVFLLSGLGIGLFASTIANTQQEAMLTVWMTLLPGIFLSGFFFPLEAMPKFLAYVSYLMPLRYYLVIIRALLLKGSSVASVQADVIAMTLFGVGIMTAAALRFRKRLD
jgi:ABC-2 type transport system permease protein